MANHVEARMVGFLLKKLELHSGREQNLLFHLFQLLLSIEENRTWHPLFFHLLQYERPFLHSCPQIKGPAICDHSEAVYSSHNGKSAPLALSCSSFCAAEGIHSDTHKKRQTQKPSCRWSFTQCLGLGMGSCTQLVVWLGHVSIVWVKLERVFAR